MNMSQQCEQCQQRYTLLRRRRPCYLCGQIFCSKCVSKSPILRNNSRGCNICLLIINQNTTREQLSTIRIKHLRAYLVHSKIVSKNCLDSCVEKKDLIDLIEIRKQGGTDAEFVFVERDYPTYNISSNENITTASATSTPPSSSPPTSTSVASTPSPTFIQTSTSEASTPSPSSSTTTSPTLTQTSTSEASTPSPSSSTTTSSTLTQTSISEASTPPPSSSTTSPTLTQTSTSEASTPPPSSSTTTSIASTPQPSSSTTTSTTSTETTTITTSAASTPTTATNVNDTEEIQQPTRNTNEEVPPLNTTSSGSSNEREPKIVINLPSNQKPVRITLDQVSSIESIQNLTVFQLKDILRQNFVSTTGCVEKSELIDKVQLLYRDKKQQESNTNVASNQTDDHLCKICMDATIDCVFLDCGHLCACVQCGKRLSECPLCRSYIVRVVRVFKS